MADFLDFLLASPTKSPLPVEITPTTTLEDIIAATILPESDQPTTSESTTTQTDSADDDEALAAAILAEATAQEPETTTPTTQRTFSVTSPATETRLADSLFELLGSPPPEKPLTNNSAFSELHSLLRSELKQQTTPDTLLQLLKPKTSVFQREQQLQHRFNKLEFNNSTEVNQLSSFFKYQSALIETERYQSLHHHATKPHLRDSINNHYDDQLHKVIDRVEVSVSVLQQATDSQTAKPTSTDRPSSLRRRQQLSRRSISLMEEWYQLNIDHPYPDSAVIQSIAQQGDIKEEQVKKWFSNKRSRSHNTHSRSVINSHKMSTRVNRCGYYTPY